MTTQITYVKNFEERKRTQLQGEEVERRTNLKKKWSDKLGEIKETEEAKRAEILLQEA